MHPIGDWLGKRLPQLGHDLLIWRCHRSASVKAFKVSQVNFPTGEMTRWTATAFAASPSFPPANWQAAGRRGRIAASPERRPVSPLVGERLSRRYDDAMDVFTPFPSTVAVRGDVRRNRC
jgi:hypothetical protein